MQINPKEIPVPRLFGLMVDTVAPRPIAFASTIDREGNPNLAPFSFFNTFGANPPLLAFSPSRRGKGNTTKDTLENLKKVPEVVINVVNFEMVEQVNLASSDFPAGVSEFVKAGFTPVESCLVKPFRVKESPVQFECKVLYTYESSKMGSAGNLIVCEVVMMHIDDRVLNENGTVDPEKLDLVGRMGQNYYCRIKDGLFTVEKPTLPVGVGIDNLPDDIKNSTILTGNDLGKLGMVRVIPDKTAILEFTERKEIKDLIGKHSGEVAKLGRELHLLAKKMLNENLITEALKVLLIETIDIERRSR